jgi:hemoglobin/transferrin/lactoferrin receptor protein
MIKPAFLTCLSLFLVFRAFAQGITLQGTVLDAGSGHPVQAAWVCLLKSEGSPNKSNVITSSVTRQDGNFELTAPIEPEFFLGIFCLGYKTHTEKITEDHPEDLIIRLENTAYTLDELTIRSLKFDIPVRQSPMPLTLWTEEQIEKNPALNLSGILDDDPGITLVRDGIWGTTVNLRGFLEDRIVFIIDGARLETATDVAGAFSLVHNSDIKRIEVIKGASSSIYGSKAMGGVVQVFTGSREFPASFRAGGSASLEYHSANNLWSENLNLKVGSKKWYLGITGTNRNAGNMQTPEGLLENSGFNDRSVAIQAGLRPFENQEINLTYQNFHGWDIGIPGGQVFPANSTVKYRNADRQLISVDYRIDQIGRTLDHIELKFYRQSILRDVEVKFPENNTTNPPQQLRKISPSGNHIVTGTTLQGLTRVGDLSLLTGIDLWQRSLHSERKREFIRYVYDSLSQSILESSFTVFEQPLPDATSRNFGLFVHGEYELFRDKLLLLANSRIDYILNKNDSSINPLYTVTDGETNLNPPGQKVIYEPGSNDLFTWAVNFGLNYTLNDRLQTSLNLGRSYRAPSIEELYKFIDLGSRIEYGNPELQPESGFFMDWGFTYNQKKFRIGGNVYFNDLHDLIALYPVEEVPLEYRQEYPVYREGAQIFQNRNVERARIYGFETEARYRILHNTDLYGNIGYVTGKNRTDETWLPLMPPLHGKLGIHNRWWGVIESDLSAIIFGDQARIAQGETETGGYIRYDLYLNSKQFNLKYFRFELTGGIENIFDTTYTSHLTVNRGGIQYEPGRNIFLKGRIIF